MTGKCKWSHLRTTGNLPGSDGYLRTQQGEKCNDQTRRSSIYKNESQLKVISVNIT